MRDLIRVWATVAFALLQIAVPLLGYAGWLGRTTGAEFQTAKTPVVPASYAFSIWSLIFAACLVYALEQARPSRRQDHILRRVGWPMAGAMAVNAAWSALAQLEYPLALLFVLFLAGFAASLVAATRLFGAVAHKAVSWRIGPAVGLQAGWVTVAVFANLSVALAEVGLGEALGRSAQALALLSLSGAVACAVVWSTRGALTYVAAVSWALVALMVGNLTREDAPTVAAGAAGWLTLVLATTLAARRRKWIDGPPGHPLARRELT